MIFFLGTVSSVLLVLNLFLLVQLRRARSKNKRLVKQYAKIGTNTFQHLKHEFRTPLSIIKGSINLIKEPQNSNESAESERWLKVMEKNCDYLLGLLASIDHIDGKIQFLTKVEKVKTLEFFNSIENLVTIDKGNQLQITIHPDVPAKMKVYKVELTQVLVNLLTNANKFTHDGTIKLVVQSNPTKSPCGLTISVVDDGTGIPKDEITHIFEPFYQGKNAQNPDVKGLGIGLGITRDLLKRLQGSISVESEYGNGSTFKIDLPVEQVEFEQETSTEEESLNYPHNQKQRVLLVDDAEDILLLYERYLMRQDYEVLTATNGKEAVDIVKTMSETENPVACILMDLRMPVLDGYQATRLLRKYGFTTPIIAVTAHDSSQNKEAINKFGFNKIMVKPLLKNHLIGLLDDYCHKADNRGLNRLV